MALSESHSGEALRGTVLPDGKCLQFMSHVSMHLSLMVAGGMLVFLMGREWCLCSNYYHDYTGVQSVDRHCSRCDAWPMIEYEQSENPDEYKIK